MTEQLTLSLQWEAENHFWVYAFISQEQFYKSSNIIFNLSQKYEEITSSQEKRFPYYNIFFSGGHAGRVAVVLC